MKKNEEESVDCVGLDCDRSPCRQRCYNCNNFTNRCVDHFLGKSNSEPLCKSCYMRAYKTITNEEIEAWFRARRGFRIHPIAITQVRKMLTGLDGLSEMREEILSKRKFINGQI